MSTTEALGADSGGGQKAGRAWEAMACPDSIQAELSGRMPGSILWPRARRALGVAQGLHSTIFPSGYCP